MPEPEELDRELARARDELAAAKERADLLRIRYAEMESSMRNQTQHLAEENRKLRQKMKKIYASKSWKLAWAMSRAMRAARNPRWALAKLKERRTGQAAPALPAADMTVKRPETPAEVAEFELHENTEIRDAYERALRKRAFVGIGGARVVMAVHTLDLSQGRGDIYVAVGLGRYLERIGYDVVYLPRDEWYSLPVGTQYYIALLDEVDLFKVPPTCTRIAWIRNRTAEWMETRSLALYDAILTSSERSLAEVKRGYAGPAGILRIGVDHELFNGSAENGSRHGVSTTVNQWGTERQLFRSLVQGRLDFPLALYGEQRGLNPELSPYWAGKVSFFALPSLYVQSALVLDDHNHTTQPFGNVNSRVYEALACGAPLLTNSALGLNEIGLADVPSYTSSKDLDEVIHDVLRDPEGVRPLVKSLQRRVLEDHTFAKRAEQFDAFIGSLGDAKPSPKLIVGFWPDYRATNPYQSMLYGFGSNPDLVAVPVPEPQWVAQSALAGGGHAFVYHLHWTAPIIGPAQNERDARKRAREFVDGVDELRARGGKFVWTIHNAVPHEMKFPEVEVELDQMLADRCDMVHVMCADTVDLVSPYYRLDRSRVRIIEHPSYAGVYPNVLDQDAARAELGLLPHHTVLTFFGGIRPYKGVEELLDAFEQASAVDPSLRLIVAGPPGRFPEVETLRDRCAGNPAIVSNFNRIADGDVQVFLNAADVVVLPHRAVLNSGSLLLALSFGRPVIAPVTGCVRDLLTPDVAMTFEAGNTASLRDAVARAAELKGDEWRRAAYAKADAFRVEDIAARFAAALQEL